LGDLINARCGASVWPDAGVCCRADEPVRKTVRATRLLDGHASFDAAIKAAPDLSPPQRRASRHAHPKLFRISELFVLISTIYLSI
jgi:hypothetical protein